MKDIDLVNDNILQLNNETGGSYDYGDWEQDSIMLPEIIVTPDGIYTRDEWDRSEERRVGKECRL